MGLEITSVPQQTVVANENVLFTDTPVRGGNCIVHREGSGIVTLRGLTNQCFARYRVSFNGNIAVPTGGTAGAISLALAINGETVGSTQAIVTPTAVASFFNVSGDVFIQVPKGCCFNVSLENTSGIDIVVSNANLIAERVA